MGKVDELMALAHDAEAVDRRCCIGKATGSEVTNAYQDLRPALESALNAEYECGRQVGADQEHALLRLADEAQGREQDAEPAAWAVYDIKYGGSVSLHLNEFHCLDGDETRFRVVPLYASPPKRRPLTDHISGKYNELLLAVGNKYPGESRHETALRYIMRAERANESDAKLAHGIGDE